MSNTNAEIFSASDFTDQTNFNRNIAQHFRVGVKLYESSALEIMSSELKSHFETPDTISLFNSSASFTYLDFPNSTIYGDIGHGHLGSDFLGVGLKTNIIYPQDNSSYVLTLGGYDTSNCANEWSSAPQLMLTIAGVDKMTATAAVYVNSITTTFRGTDVRIALNKTMLIDYNCIANTAHSYEYGYMPHYMKFFFTEAVQAVLFNEPEYIMDCEAEIAGKLIIHVGYWSSSTNISLSGADLAMRYETTTSTPPAHKYSCFLPILGYYDDSWNSFCLPPTVWNNHCYAYNFVAKEVGFSKSLKVQKPYEANLGSPQNSKIKIKSIIAQSTVSYVSYTEKSVNQLYFGSDYVTPHLRCMAITTSALKKTPTNNSRKKLLAGVVTMGTPRQGPFWIVFDLFRGNNLAVIYLFDKHNTDKLMHNNNNQPVYDPTKSSTFSNLSTYWSADSFELGTLYTNLSFSLDHVTSDTFGMVGYVSLYVFMKQHFEEFPFNYYYYNDSALVQMVRNANQPIFALWSDRWNPIKNAEITIGELDSENCVDNWTFAPRLYDRSIPEGYLIFLDSITLDFNGTMATVDIGKRVLLEYWEGDMNKTGEVPYHLKFFFAYAAGAIYNMSSRNYEVDCSLAGADNVILNFGDPNHANQAPRIQLVMSPRDYIYYENELKKCIVAFEGYVEETSTVNDTIKLPLAFWNNHCFAYNLETEEVGFADSKVQNNNLAQIIIL
ncbi:hypothetical protein DdX_05829 [Ditylenchus destructor]|uniref:Uncharacterized protein n=1 Tax=Ditylenchus destructor TaxID=166010 RepID=A0AAD4NCV4_9BILA|nr:hypothetical protein DdX_05829 [Ditylenchus destructor]